MLALAPLVSLAAPPSSPALADPVFAEIASGAKSLKKGDKGGPVEAIQTLLTLFNYCVSTPCRTGLYDDVTAKAVWSFGTEWGEEKPDDQFDAEDLGFLDSRMTAAVYAPIRAAGPLGVRYDVPVSAGQSADDVRLALIKVAVLRADPPAVLAANRDSLQSVTPPTPAEVAAGRKEVWLQVDVVQVLLR